VRNKLDPGEVLTVWDQGFGAFKEPQEVIGGKEGDESIVGHILDELFPKEFIEWRRRSGGGRRAFESGAAWCYCGSS